MNNQLKFSEITNIIPKVKIVIDRLAYPGWNVAKRTITDHELVLILSGNGSVIVNGVLHKACPNKLFYFYPGLVHAMESAQDHPLHFFAVHFEFEYSGQDLRGAQLLPIEPVSIINNGHKVSDAFLQLYKVWQQKSPGWRWRQNILLQNLIYEILFDLNHPDGNPANLNRVQTVLDYIANNYKEKITIACLCGLVNLSPGYFNELFKRSVGKTPVEYINRFRIDCSKELLINTSMKISEVAECSGFEDPLYYARLFSKMESCTPTEYRKLTVREQ